jgi:PleD family two-component response regulator
VRQRVARTGGLAIDERVLPPVTISVGVSSLGSRDTAETLLERGSAALERAKEGGRNRVALEALSEGGVAAPPHSS